MALPQMPLPKARNGAAPPTAAKSAPQMPPPLARHTPTLKRQQTALMMPTPPKRQQIAKKLFDGFDGELPLTQPSPQEKLGNNVCSGDSQSLGGMDVEDIEQALDTQPAGPDEVALCLSQQNQQPLSQPPSMEEPPASGEKPPASVEKPPSWEEKPSLSEEDAKWHATNSRDATRGWWGSDNWKREPWGLKHDWWGPTDVIEASRNGDDWWGNSAWAGQHWGHNPWQSGYYGQSGHDKPQEGGEKKIFLRNLKGRR